VTGLSKKTSRAALERFERFLLFAPVILLSMVAHEYAHAYAALKQGDTTAQRLGRVTWNPLKHIDPFLTIVMPLITFLSMGFIFGGAKPVPVDPRNYRNVRRGDIIVSLAGIATNLLLVPVLAIVIVAIGFVGRAAPGLAPYLFLLQVMAGAGIWVNLLLAVFNLMPIPPLDGSHVMKYLLPPAWAVTYQRLAGAGFIILIVLMMIGAPVIRWWLAPVNIIDGFVSETLRPFLVPGAWNWWLPGWRP
jgi:Zn-dependent protease